MNSMFIAGYDEELIRSGFAALVLKMVGIAVGYLFILLITRKYGASVMGLFVLAFTILQIFTVIGRLGLDTALLRFIAEYRISDRSHRVREVYYKSSGITIISSIILSIVLFFFAPFIANDLFHKENMTVYLYIAAFAVGPSVFIFINSESIRGIKGIKEFVFLQYIAIFLFPIITLLLVMNVSNKDYVPFLSYIIGLYITAAISVYLWFNKSKINDMRKSNDLKMRDILKVSMPMLLTSSLFLVMQWIDTIMLGMLRSESEVGIYNVAFRISAGTTIMLFAINSMAGPKISEFYSKRDMKGLETIAQQSTKIIFWSSSPILLVIFLAPSFILGLFGEEFRIGVYALILLTFGQMFNSLCGPVWYMLQMTGRQITFLFIIIVSALLNVILNLILIPRFGINGAAVASMIGLAFWNLSSVAYIKKDLNILTIYLPSKIINRYRVNKY
jgi:O-antigen/teichoic acid export membrane protein